MKKKLNILILAVCMLFIMTSCGSNSQSYYKEDYSLAISGEGIDVAVTAEDFANYELEEVTCESVASEGGSEEVTFKAFSLNTILEDKGISMDGITSVTMTAVDGYKMTVPTDGYAKSGFYLIQEEDGEALEMPRTALPDQFRNFWVNDLISLEFGNEAVVQADAEKDGETVVSEEVTEIVFFREGISTMELTTVDYDGLDVEAWSLKDFSSNVLGAESNGNINIRAKDGYTKTETADTYDLNYIAFETYEDEAENMPIYFSDQTKPGMRVKQIEVSQIGSSAIYFGEENTLEALIEETGLINAKTYDLVCSDGFTMTIPGEALVTGKVIMDKEDGMKSSFDYDLSDVPGKGKAKHLLKIVAGEKAE